MIPTNDQTAKRLNETAEKKIVFVTNNSSETREKLKNKFDRLGVQADVVGSLYTGAFRLVSHTVPPQDEIFGCAYASAVYISSVIKLPKDQKVYVIGMAGIEGELTHEGVSYIGGTVRLSFPPLPQPILKHFHNRRTQWIIP